MNIIASLKRAHLPIEVSIKYNMQIFSTMPLRPTLLDSELVQLKLNIGASDGDSTPSEEKRGTPTYRSGGLKKLDNLKIFNVLIKDNPFIR